MSSSSVRDPVSKLMWRAIESIQYWTSVFHIHVYICAHKAVCTHTNMCTNTRKHTLAWMLSAGWCTICIIIVKTPQHSVLCKHDRRDLCFPASVGQESNSLMDQQFCPWSLMSFQQNIGQDWLQLSEGFTGAGRWMGKPAHSYEWGVASFSTWSCPWHCLSVLTCWLAYP